MIGSVTWLHLSDLHVCKPKTGWDARRVLKTLRTDLQRMETRYSLRPDLIFFTGDAAFGQLGKSKGERLQHQFEDAHFFFEQVRTAFTPEVPQSNVFIVPGNHDVDRTKVTDGQTEWLDKRKDAHAVNDLIHQKELNWRQYMERLKEYRSFLKKFGYTHLLEDEDRLAYGLLRNVNGIQVGIGGLNSAWSCCREVEKGKLWLGGSWQLNEVQSRIEQALVSVALIHHPVSWFVSSEDPVLWPQIERDFRFCLHGHEHTAWVDEKANGHVRIAAAACYDRSDKDNGYNFVRLDWESSGGKVYLRKYDAAGGGWVPRVVADRTDDAGIWSLDHLSWLEKAKREVRGPSIPLAQVAPILSKSSPIVAEPRAASESDQREATDVKKLLALTPQFPAIIRGMRDVLSDKALIGASGPKMADALSRTVLLRAHLILRDFCPGAVPCLKVAESRDILRCYYPPQVLPAERSFSNVPIEGSFAGEALRKDECIIVPDLSKNTFKKHSEELAEALKKSNVKGLAAFPIRVRRSPRGALRPVAILKVDFPDVNGLVDNYPTRCLLETISDCLALAFQHGLALSTFRRRHRRPRR